MPQPIRSGSRPIEAIREDIDWAEDPAHYGPTTANDLTALAQELRAAERGSTVAVTPSESRDSDEFAIQARSGAAADAEHVKGRLASQGGGFSSAGVRIKTKLELTVRVGEALVLIERGSRAPVLDDLVEWGVREGVISREQADAAMETGGTAQAVEKHDRVDLWRNALITPPSGESVDAATETGDVSHDDLSPTEAEPTPVSTHWNAVRLLDDAATHELATALAQVATAEIAKMQTQGRGSPMLRAARAARAASEHLVDEQRITNAPDVARAFELMVDQMKIEDSQKAGILRQIVSRETRPQCLQKLENPVASDFSHWTIGPEAKAAALDPDRSEKGDDPVPFERGVPRLYPRGQEHEMVHAEGGDAKTLQERTKVAIDEVLKPLGLDYTTERVHDPAGSVKVVVAQAHRHAASLALVASSLQGSARVWLANS